MVQLIACRCIKAHSFTLNIRISSPDQAEDVRIFYLNFLFWALPTFVVDGIVTGEQDLRNRYDLIPLGEQVVENIRQRLGRVLTRVVEQHDRPALHLACHALRDLTRRDALPVEGIPTGSTWKRLSCLASWPPLTVFFPPIHSPPLNMTRINSILSPDTQQELLPQNCGSSFVKFNLRLLKSAKQEHTSFFDRPGSYPAACRSRHRSQSSFSDALLQPRCCQHLVLSQ